MSRPKKTAVIEYRSYFLAPEFPVLLLSGEHWRISDIPSGRLHFHNYPEIGICHTDSGILEVNDIPYHFKAGDVTFLPKNVPHTTYSDKGTASRWSYIYFDLSAMMEGLLPPSISVYEFSGQYEELFYPLFSKEEHPEIYQQAAGVVYELENKRPGYQVTARCLITSLCVSIWRAMNDIRISNQSQIPQGSSPDNFLVIAPVLDYIEKSYSEDLTTEQLSDLCHLSPTHFRRVFLQIMGTSPLEYLNQIRIFKACDLMRSTEDSILAISENVGFKSIATFNRRFSSLMQMSPRTYRSNMLQSEKRNEKQTILEFTGWMQPE
ncbi:MAG: AraC family transcriptional regulator [Lachnospiraceae bacterium]|nr:AraC family transcriptional regulator [Lachnospiraceae bacterium]